MCQKRPRSATTQKSGAYDFDGLMPVDRQAQAERWGGIQEHSHVRFVDHDVAQGREEPLVSGVARQDGGVQHVRICQHLHAGALTYSCKFE
jgi:hypothetical protein